MEWSEDKQRGFALAATSRGDRGAAQAVGGLASAIRESATVWARRVAETDRAARQRWVHEQVARLASLRRGEGSEL